MLAACCLAQYSAAACLPVWRASKVLSSTKYAHLTALLAEARSFCLSVCDVADCLSVCLRANRQHGLSVCVCCLTRKGEPTTHECVSTLSGEIGVAPCRTRRAA
jgi:hypothetical protein